MRNDIPPNLLSHLGRDVTTIAYLWRVIRADGFIACLTDLDVPLTVDGERYQPGGFTPTATTSSSDMSVATTQTDGLMDSDIFDENELRKGLWDRAEVQLLACNWERPQDGKFMLSRGYLGEFVRKGTRYAAELRSISENLQTATGVVIGPRCPHSVYDKKCNLKKADYQKTGSVAGVLARDVFIADQDFDDCSFGFIEWTSGENAGTSSAIKAVDGRKIIVQEATLFFIAQTDTFHIYPGCNKSPEMCFGRFNNMLYFAGFPNIPGRDALQNPGVSSE